ncbi:MAG: hypothetical protein ACTHU0_34475 [Kofleriaceae bacterium]
MTTVARTFRSIPHRSAMETWTAIVELLTRGKPGDARTELLAIAGVASSLVADQFMRDDAIVVTCDGPRTRIYCTYDESALEGADASEEPLGFDPLVGRWHVSLPCGTEELEWVQSALEQHAHVSARALGERVTKHDAVEERSDALVVDVRRFLGK